MTRDCNEDVAELKRKLRMYESGDEIASKYIRMLQSELDKCRCSNLESAKTIAGLEKDGARLRWVLEKGDELASKHIRMIHSELEELETKLRSSEVGRALANKECGRLQAVLAERESGYSSSETAKSLASLQKDNVRLRNEVRFLEEELAEHEGLQKQVFKLEGHIQSLEDELQASKREKFHLKVENAAMAEATKADGAAADPDKVDDHIR